MAEQEDGTAGRRITGPRGEHLRVLEQAGPVKLRPAPRIAAEAGGELLTLKHGRMFVCSRPNGDINPGLATGEGVYADDTRYLSRMQLRLDGRAPVLLSWANGSAYEGNVELTNPELDDGEVPQMTLSVRRRRVVNENLYERIEVHNHGQRPVELTVSLRLGCDFADIFEVRGVRQRISRGELLEPETTESGVAFGYRGEDRLFRQTFVAAEPVPEVAVEGPDARLSWALRLPPRGVAQLTVSVAPSLQGKRGEDTGIDAARRAAEEQVAAWRRSCTSIQGPYPSFNRVIAAAQRDLGSLMIEADGERLVAAGIPWYVAPFGRDALFTAYEMLMLDPDAARGTLRYLARHQAVRDDPERDAEPGKILHELRVGELARCGYIPHTPYYGSVDATPLFLMLAGAYHRWTADLTTLAELRPALDAAVEWMRTYGDLDGDGFIEYRRRSPAGLVNQGWKDSEDSVIHADGSRAEPPIALVEVQGYAYLARMRIADVYDELGERDVAAELRREATRLRRAFNDAFWMPEEDTYALALDGSKRQVRSVTSNPGHCLYCGIADPDKGRKTADRLVADDLFSGWGVRTLSAGSPAYNPVSYHNGSVWPHDNAIVAAGIKRYGAQAATEKIVGAVFDAALAGNEARLPELLCGFPRTGETPYVAYPVACRPQAWAAAAPFMILQALLGVSASAQAGLLEVHQPHLPAWIDAIELRNLRVGAGRVALSFSRRGTATAVAVLDISGDIRVTIHQG